MFNYTEVTALAKSILVEFGAPVTRRAVTAGAYNPATGTAVVTNIETQRTGVVFDFGPGQTTERGSLVQVGDKRLIIEADGPCLLTDIYVIQGKEYAVVSVGEVNPAGIRAIYDLHLRA